MDPLSLAGSFATIVGLLASFKAERSGSSLEEFLIWMHENQQASIAASITQNQKVHQALSTVLATNHDDLVAQLQSVTEQLTEIVSHKAALYELSSALGGSVYLSPQARAVLAQIASSSAKFVMQHRTLSSVKFLLMDGGHGEIHAEEPRFLEEDFAALVSAGYLRSDLTTKGTPRFYITRAGMQATKGH